MKKIINFIIDQKLESLDDYPALVQPIADEFNLDFGIAEGIINTVIEWECSNTVNSLEEVLVRKFPSVVTN
jgi:hypothetical protein